MHVVLKEIATGKTILVRQGQVVTVGRTEWADHAFPSDVDLLPIHFSIELTTDFVRAVSADNAVLIVDETEQRIVPLTPGLVFIAGNTQFLVDAAPMIAAADQADDSVETAVETPSPDTTEPVREGWVSAEATLTALSLEPLSESDAIAADQPTALIQALMSQQRHSDAIQAVAWILPRPDGLQWAIECTERLTTETTTEDQTAIAAARKWLDDPTPENAAAAEQVVQEVGTDRPSGWLAQAVHWCSDDIAGSDQIKVPPPPPLFSAAIKGALVNLAFACRPDDPVSVFEKCLTDALQRLPAG